MKIRTDFVTNSSSSSFIVAFPTEPASSGEVETMLFEQIGLVEHPYNSSEVHSTREIADRVYRDIVSQKKPTVLKLAKEFSSLDYYEGDAAPQVTIRERPGIWSSRDKRNPRYYLGEELVTREDGTTYTVELTDWELHQKDCIEWGKQKTKNFMDKHKGMAFYRFCYADDEGEGWLEHGDIFKKLPHVQISHH